MYFGSAFGSDGDTNEKYTVCLLSLVPKPLGRSPPDVVELLCIENPI